MRTIASQALVTLSGSMAIAGVFRALETVQSTTGASASPTTILGLCVLVAVITIAFAIRNSR
jgi:hypothetical protein